MVDLSNEDNWQIIYTNSASVSGQPGYNNRLPEFVCSIPFLSFYFRIFANSNTAPSYYQYAGAVRLFIGSVEDELPIYVTQRKFTLGSSRLMYFVLESSTPYHLSFLPPYWLPDITVTVEQFQPIV